MNLSLCTVIILLTLSVFAASQIITYSLTSADYDAYLNDFPSDCPAYALTDTEVQTVENNVTTIILEGNEKQLPLLYPCRDFEGCPTPTPGYQMNVVLNPVTQCPVSCNQTLIPCPLVTCPANCPYGVNQSYSQADVRHCLMACTCNGSPQTTTLTSTATPTCMPILDCAAAPKGYSLSIVLDKTGCAVGCEYRMLPCPLSICPSDCPNNVTNGVNTSDSRNCPTCICASSSSTSSPSTSSTSYCPLPLCTPAAIGQVLIQDYDVNKCPSSCFYQIAACPAAPNCPPQSGQTRTYIYDSQGCITACNYTSACSNIPIPTADPGENIVTTTDMNGCIIGYRRIFQCPPAPSCAPKRGMKSILIYDSNSCQVDCDYEPIPCPPPPVCQVRSGYQTVYVTDENGCASSCEYVARNCPFVAPCPTDCLFGEIKLHNEADARNCLLSCTCSPLPVCSSCIPKRVMRICAPSTQTALSVASVDSAIGHNNSTSRSSVGNNQLAALSDNKGTVPAPRNLTSLWIGLGTALGVAALVIIASVIAIIAIALYMRKGRRNFFSIYESRKKANMYAGEVTDTTDQLQPFLGYDEKITDEYHAVMQEDETEDNFFEDYDEFEEEYEEDNQ